MKNLNFWLLLFIVFPSFTTAQNYQDSLDRAMYQVLAEDILPGFGVSVFTQDKVIYSKGFGYADKKNKIAYTPKTIHNIGSVSKTFIGVAIMKAVEEGKVNLDTKINDILPFKIDHPRYPDQAITLEHLATHTSGIKDGKPYDKAYVITDTRTLKKEDHSKEFWKEYVKMKAHPNMSMPDYFQKVLTKNGSLYSKKNYYKHAPGEKYAYSNIGAALAAYVVELATGEKFESYTRKHIMTPIGMNASGWHFDEVDMQTHSQLYMENKDEIPRYTLITFPDGGFISSVHDLTLYIQEIMRGYHGNGKILTSASFQNMLTLHTPPEDEYGIFWELTTEGRIGHNGADPGIFTYMQFDPKTGIGRIFFTNTDASKKSVDMLRKVWKALGKYGKKLNE